MKEKKCKTCQFNRINDNLKDVSYCHHCGAPLKIIYIKEGNCVNCGKIKSSVYKVCSRKPTFFERLFETSSLCYLTRYYLGQI